MDNTTKTFLLILSFFDVIIYMALIWNIISTSTKRAFQKNLKTNFYFILFTLLINLFAFNFRALLVIKFHIQFNSKELQIIDRAFFLLSFFTALPSLFLSLFGIYSTPIQRNPFFSIPGIVGYTLTAIMNTWRYLVIAYFMVKTKSTGFNIFSLMIFEISMHFFTIIICLTIGHGSNAYTKSDSKTPEFKFSLFSQVFLFWVDKMLYRCGNKSIKAKDLPELNYKERVVLNESKIRKHWINPVANNYKRKNMFIEYYRLLLVYKKQFWISIIIKLVQKTAEVSYILLISHFIKVIASESINFEIKSRLGIIVTVAFFISYVLSEVSAEFLLKMNALVGYKLKQGLTKAIYDGIFSKKFYLAEKNGSATNLISQDVDLIAESVYIFHNAWASLIFIFVYAYLLYKLVASAIIYSLLIFFILLIPSNWFIAKFLLKFKAVVLSCADKRVKMTTEFITNLRILKLYGWNKIFADRISKQRKEEQEIYKKYTMLSEIFGIFWALSPFILKFSIFYFKLKDSTQIAFISFFQNKISSRIIFIIIQLQLLVNLFPIFLITIINSIIATKRISGYLIDIKEKRSNLDVSNKCEEKKTLVTIKNAEFFLENGTSLIIDELKLKKNEIISVIGETGSGKSLLLSAICQNLGTPLINTDKTIYEINTNNIGYAPQTAWVFNSSIKDNILFGSNYSSTLYKSVLLDTKLYDDLQLAPKKDHTILGYAGFQLSGGQMHRLGMARAFYCEAPLIVLDDNFAGLDNNVANFVLKNLVLKRKEGKAIVIATNSRMVVENSDKVILVKNGKIAAIENPEVLLQQEEVNSLFKEKKPAESFRKSRKMSNELIETETLEMMAPLGNRKDSLKVEVKDAEVDYLEGKEKIQWVDRKFWFISIGGFSVFFFFFLFNLSSQYYQILANKLFDNALAWNEINSFFSFVGFQLLINLLATNFEFIKNLIDYRMFNNSFCFIHDALLYSISKCKLSLLDSPKTSPGSLINHFTSDLFPIDYKFSQPLRVAIFILSAIFVSFWEIITENLYLLYLVLPLSIFVFFFFLIYIKHVRKLKSIFSRSISPIYGNLINTIQGVSIIKIMNKENYMKNKQIGFIDTNSKVNYSYICLIRWLSIRFAMCIPVFIAVTMVYFSLFDNNYNISFILFLLLSVCLNLKFFIQFYSEIERIFINIKRIKDAANLQSEEEGNKQVNSVEEAKEEVGLLNEVSFENVSIIVPSRKQILSNISFTIHSGEKLAIVGRTGSGKSTLLSAILRVVSVSQGRIFVNGIDTEKIKLSVLRQLITIIPQDATMFNASLRYNIDPLDKANIEEINEVLKMTNLQTLIQEKGGLEYTVKENGKNLSVGERQLVCLARALIRKTEIILIDEATASLDYKVDSLIQKTLRETFCSATIITVAHRLETILDYDKVIVMEAGKIKEFGKPAELLKNKKSEFALLYNKNN